MFTCINCDFKFTADQMDLGERVCNECLNKQRYCMEVEFDVDPNSNRVDYNVLVDDSLEWLLRDYKEAKNKGFHSKLGPCPNIKILCVTDIIDGIVINKNEIKLILEEM